VGNNKDWDKPETAEDTAQEDIQTRTIRDGSNIRSVYADVVNISSNREEIVLLFGLSPDRSAARTEVTVQLTDRITLNPYTARRLNTLLNNLIHDYESRYGPLETESPSLTGLSRRPSHRTTLPKTGGADKKADLLFQLTNDLNVPIGAERSFKIAKNTILANRFLLGFEKDTIQEKPHERILDICGRMDMPGDLLEAFEQHLPDAKYIHFGFEENKGTCVYKAYLEFYDRIEREMRSSPSTTEHFLMHLGFKWDVSDKSRQAITRYTWYPYLSVENSMKKLSNILDSNQHQAPLELTKGVLNIALRRIPHHDILILDVNEQDNPRKSFDINIYSAKFQLSELYPFLLDMGRHYSIPYDQLHNLYEPIKNRIFGHLSGGIDREGKDFLTVYYGVESLNEDSAKPDLPAVTAPFTGRASRIIHPRKKLSFAGVERTDEKAGKLFQIINSLNVQVGFERSFKVLRDTLLADRFLAGFERESIRQKPHESIVNVCRQIDMPEDFLETFQENLPDSNIVLFGFEGNEKNRIYKAYLEFGHRITEAVKENPDNPEPFLIHMGFKWDVSDNSKKSKTKYTCFPFFTVQDMLKRLTNVIYSPIHKSPFEIVEGIINLATNRVGPYEFIYFEASETDNPRISFDINMYRANLRIKEIYPLLMDIMSFYSIPDEQFHNLYEAVSSLIFGHLTGGVDREGKDFLTVYFGEKGSTR